MFSTAARTATRSLNSQRRTFVDGWVKAKDNVSCLCSVKLYTHSLIRALLCTTHAHTHINTYLHSSTHTLTPLPPQIATERAIQNKGGNWLGADGPTYLKQPGDTAVVLVGMAIMGVSTVQLCSGFWHMAHGTGKNDE
jgi:hypothetical protein